MSFLRLKNIQFGYNLSNRYTKKAGINNLRVYLTAENLLTVTNYRGIDPERQGENSDSGKEYYPLMRSYSFGVNVGF